jgi:hypothetical protein
MAITLEQLEALFESVRSRPGWNPETPLPWSYFFTDPDLKKVEEVASFLRQGGYRIVNLYPTRGGSATCLHVQRAECHTPTSLFERNKVFQAIAQEFGIESYDGMDVGGPTSTPGSLSHGQ